MFSMRTAGEKDIRMNADLEERDHGSYMPAIKQTTLQHSEEMLASKVFLVMRCRKIRVNERDSSLPRVIFSLEDVALEHSRRCETLSCSFPP